MLGRLLLAVRPEAVGAELLLAAGLLAVVFAVTALLRTLRVPVTTSAPGDPEGFAELRVLLRVSVATGLAFPIAVTAYWACSALWTLAQQLVLSRVVRIA